MKKAIFRLFVQLTKRGVLHNDLHPAKLITSGDGLSASDFDRAIISSEQTEVAAYREWLREGEVVL